MDIRLFELRIKIKLFLAIFPNVNDNVNLICLIAVRDLFHFFLLISKKNTQVFQRGYYIYARTSEFINQSVFQNIKNHSNE